MRKMTDIEQMDMIGTILYHLSLSVDDEAAIKIADSKNEKGVTVMEAIMDDIKTSSAWEDDGHYNDDDVRLAIGIVLMSRLNIEI